MKTDSLNDKRPTESLSQLEEIKVYRGIHITKQKNGLFAGYYAKRYTHQCFHIEWRLAPDGRFIVWDCRQNLGYPGHVARRNIPYTLDALKAQLDWAIEYYRVQGMPSI